MINLVIKWEYGMVTVFNRNGKQVPQYQGTYQEVKDKILADAPPEAVFAHGIWHKRSYVPIQRDKW